ncbi:hypothetical protein OIU78_009638 [Salix suchowensis]|nr:hypothetical protein OIU78_009638 [Salix suchowensis]KAJ6341515.1 hypothetical protein OIU78_009638 [Salix suchowensis]KAJ6341516.1 hypothetical protein OIU78_009638 [Salix suchowensis]KAJ6341517.1 hypothetical protein OIU78_009638 [Salix suchowensis]KAJ6341518.1 hypothetical protein OIU78_009638 [Salix suchowensis]
MVIFLEDHNNKKERRGESDGELAKDPKKMKEGLKQNLDKEIAQLSNIVENQENQMDDLTHQLKELGYEELEELNEKFAILCPGPSWDVYMSVNRRACRHHLSSEISQPDAGQADSTFIRDGVQITIDNCCLCQFSTFSSSSIYVFII